MKLFFFFVSLLSFLCFGSSVEVLTNENFTKTENGAWLIKFYAPWCPHCQALAPIWEEFASSAKEAGHPYHVAEVDCTENHYVCDDVRGYPTLRLIQHSAGIDSLQIPLEERSADYLLSWASDNVDFVLARAPPLSYETSAALSGLVEASKAFEEIAQRAQGLEERVEALKLRTESHRIYNKNHGFKPPQGIRELTDDDYEQTINEGNWVVLFGAEWCMECAGEAVEAFEELGKEETSRYSFAYVDCGKSVETCKKEKVLESLPKVVGFDNQNGIRDSSLPGVTKEGLNQYLKLLFP